MIHPDPVFKFNPIPANGTYIRVVNTKEGDHYLADHVPFLAVTEYYDNDGVKRESLCFVTYDNGGFFDVHIPGDRSDKHFHEFLPAGTDMIDGKPVFVWDYRKKEYWHAFYGNIEEFRTQFRSTP
jgi:hypothetical protein